MNTPVAHQARPADWPAPGSINLEVQDLPHASSTTEWWYFNTHLDAADGRKLSVFACFFRIVAGKDARGMQQHAHSLAWAISDVATGAYLAQSQVDAAAPRIGLEKIKQGMGSKDARLNRAMVEVLERGRVPRPDRMFTGPVTANLGALELDFAGATLKKDPSGAYLVSLRDERGTSTVSLKFVPKKLPLRHGDDGVVRGVHGEDMFYYFIPRCEVLGEVTVNGVAAQVTGAGWYDHEFGAPPAKAEQRGDEGLIAWDWVSAQLDDGTDVSVYMLVNVATKQSAGRWAIVSDPTGRRYAFSQVTLEAQSQWRSVRTFHDYPTGWKLEVPEAKLSLQIDAEFADQEFVTVLSKPAFWEGRCRVHGTSNGAPVSGLAYLERSGFSDVDTLEDFFSRVGEEVRACVCRLYPLQMTRAHAERLVASPGKEAYLDGVDLPQLGQTLVAPVRLITDRSGKGWRSYAALACCDVVLGDSRKFAEWLAMPELMHVGSLIVDDVEDGSTVRRGGPTSHVVFGVPLAINAGTAAYFMGEQLLRRALVAPSDRLRLYDLYFEALRAGHAGQAIDLGGLDAAIPEAIELGASARLEPRVIAIHRLKTAVPASALSRMGAVAGGGSKEQIEAIGNFFEAIGVAFQIIDDVLNLRGFKGNLKSRGEDITHGKVTMPVAKALARLPTKEARTDLWNAIAARPTDPAIIGSVIARLEATGAVTACVTQASELVEQAWVRLDPLVEDSLAKVMLRGFGWFVLERHY